MIPHVDGTNEREKETAFVLIRYNDEKYITNLL